LAHLQLGKRSQITYFYILIVYLVEILTCKGHWTADEGGGGGDPSAASPNAGFLVRGIESYY